MARLTDVEGIGASFAEKLNAVGIETSDDLIEQCRTPQGRKDVASRTGISERLVLEWTNHAPLPDQGRR